MPSLPPPRRLSREEVAERIAKLRAEGKPVTLFTIDPALAAWQQKVITPSWVFVLLLVSGMVLLGLIVGLWGAA